MLYLVGDNIYKARAHYQAESGRIVQLMRGIYVDSTDDIDATVHKENYEDRRFNP
jgi:serine/threonine-protein kinase HipA